MNPVRDAGLSLAVSIQGNYYVSNFTYCEPKSLTG